jgi:hypothetical protein
VKSLTSILLLILTLLTLLLGDLFASERSRVAVLFDQSGSIRLYDKEMVSKDWLSRLGRVISSFNWSQETIFASFDEKAYPLARLTSSNEEDLSLLMQSIKGVKASGMVTDLEVPFRYVEEVGDLDQLELVLIFTDGRPEVWDQKSGYLSKRVLLDRRYGDLNQRYQQLLGSGSSKQQLYQELGESYHQRNLELIDARLMRIGEQLKGRVLFADLSGGNSEYLDKLVLRLKAESLPITLGSTSLKRQWQMDQLIVKVGEVIQQARFQDRIAKVRQVERELRLELEKRRVEELSLNRDIHRAHLLELEQLLHIKQLNMKKIAIERDGAYARAITLERAAKRERALSLTQKQIRERKLAEERATLQEAAALRERKIANERDQALKQAAALAKAQSRAVVQARQQAKELEAVEQKVSSMVVERGRAQQEIELLQQKIVKAKEDVRRQVESEGELQRLQLMVKMKQVELNAKNSIAQVQASAKLDIMKAKNEADIRVAKAEAAAQIATIRGHAVTQSEKIKLEAASSSKIAKVRGRAQEEIYQAQTDAAHAVTKAESVANVRIAKFEADANVKLAKVQAGTEVKLANQKANSDIKLAGVEANSSVKVATIKAAADSKVINSQLTQQSRVAKLESRRVQERAQLEAKSAKELAALKTSSAQHRAVLASRSAKERAELEVSSAKEHAELEVSSAKELAALKASTAQHRAALESRSAKERAEFQSNSFKERAKLETKSARERAELEARSQELLASSQKMLSETKANSSKQIAAVEIHSAKKLAQMESLTTQKLAKLQSQNTISLSRGKANSEILLAQKEAEMGLALAKVRAEKREAELLAASVKLSAQRELELARNNFKSGQMKLARQVDGRVALERERADRQVARAKAEAEATIFKARVDADRQIKQIKSETAVRIAQHKSIQQAVKRRMKPAPQRPTEEIKLQRGKNVANLAVVKARAQAEIARVEASLAEAEARAKRGIVAAQKKSDQAHQALVVKGQERIAHLANKLEQRHIALQEQQLDIVKKQQQQRLIRQEQKKKQDTQALMAVVQKRENILKQQLSETKFQAKASEQKLADSLKRVEQTESGLTAALLKVDELQRSGEKIVEQAVAKSRLEWDQQQAELKQEESAPLAAKRVLATPAMPEGLVKIDLPHGSAIAVAATESDEGDNAPLVVGSLAAGNSGPGAYPKRGARPAQYSIKGLISLIIPMAILMLYLLYSNPQKESRVARTKPSGGVPRGGAGIKQKIKLMLPLEEVKKQVIKPIVSGGGSGGAPLLKPRVAFKTSLDDLGIAPLVGPVTSQKEIYSAPRVVGNTALKEELAPLPPPPPEVSPDEQTALERLTSALGNIREDDSDNLSPFNSEISLASLVGDKIKDVREEERGKPLLPERATPAPEMAVMEVETISVETPSPVDGVLRALRDSIENITFEQESEQELELPPVEPVPASVEPTVVENTPKEDDSITKKEERDKWLRSERRQLKDYYSGKEDLQGRLEAELEKRTLEDDWYYLQRIDLQEGDVELWILDETGQEKKLVVDQISLGGVRSSANVLELGTVVRVVVPGVEESFEVVRSDLYDADEERTVVLLREFKDNFKSRGRWIEMINQMRDKQGAV